MEMTNAKFQGMVTSGEKEKLSKDKEGEEGFNRLFKKKKPVLSMAKCWQL